MCTDIIVVLLLPFKGIHYLCSNNQNELNMKTLFYLAISMFLLCSCNNKAKLEQEAKEKIEKEASARAAEEAKVWNEEKSLLLKAMGVTSSVKEERKLAYVKMIQKFPNLKYWDDINNSIERGVTFESYQEVIYEVKKIKGIVEE